MKKPGIIYQTDKGQYAIAYNKEQEQAFENANKVFVHLFVDRLCTKPVIDKDGEKAKSLKAADKLKFIGLND